MRVRRVVLPVAGLGTRVLPATKVIPKEMLPLVDKPTLQYIVEEAVAAGFEDVIFVTSRSKRAIEDHFDVFPELEQTLEKKGKTRELAELRRLQGMANFITVRQGEPLGLGHAILCAKEAVGNEPFAVMLGDNLVAPETPCFPDMLKLFEEKQRSVLSLFKAPEEQIPSYGIVATNDLGDGRFQVTDMIEKPSLEEAPSDLAVYGRYILTPDIFPLIEQTQPGKSGEIWLTDAIQAQAKAGDCFGVCFDGTSYDTGTPLGLVTTILALALKRPDIADGVRAYMREALAEG